MLFAMVSSGCSKAPIESDLKEYAKRLENILEHPLVVEASNDTLTYPAASELRVNIPQTTINLRDFYALDNCYVSTLIAQRNTALGKTQLPSTRFIYEVQLIEGLQQCFQQTQDLEQQQALTQWISQKSSNIQLVWTDLLQNSSEIKRTFSNNNEYFIAHNESMLAEYKASWTYLLALYIKPNSIDAARVENSLNYLRQHPLFAELWRAQSLITHHLNAVTKQLITLEPDLLCESASDQQQIEYLKNVFVMFFIERIQPFAAQLDQNHYALTPVIQSMLNNPDLNDGFKHFLSTKEKGFNAYQRSVLQHVKFWQRLFDRCDISPI